MAGEVLEKLNNAALAQALLVPGDRQVRRYNQGSTRCRYRTMSPQKGFNSATALLFDPVVTNAEAMKSVVYSSRKTASIEGRNGQFGVGLN
jgi:hypothetical protein